jgi:hypothetical protein
MSERTNNTPLPVLEVANALRGMTVKDDKGCGWPMNNTERKEAARRVLEALTRTQASGGANAALIEAIKLAMQALQAFGDTEEGVTTAYNILKDAVQ